MTTILTTSGVAAAKRLQFWQDAVCDTFVALDCRARSDAPFFGEITTTVCGDTHLSLVHSDGQQVDRTLSRIRRAREEVMLVSIQAAGTGIIAQDGREARLRPGDIACYDSTRPYTLSFSGRFEQVVLHMPRDLMMRRLGRATQWTAQRVSGSSPAASLVLPFVRQAMSVAPNVRPEILDNLAEVCLGLVTTALAEHFQEHCDDTTWARAALTLRAKAIIEHHLSDAALNTAKVAGMLGISPRYLQDLFHAEGTTVSDWIWSRRLEKSRKDLVDPAHASESIGQIALACGFSDLGHFSRRFKAAYAVSPREDRAARRAERSQ
jgi:AraC-like DNA-binding protein